MRDWQTRRKAKQQRMRMLISSVSLPEHLDVFEKGICRRIDFAYAGPQSVRMAQMIAAGTVEVGAIHT